MKPVSYVGYRFGKLLIEERIRKNNRTYYVCICDCGTRCVKDYNNLKNGNSRSCGCYRKEACRLRERAKNHPTHGRVLSYYKRNAKNRKISWELTNEQFTTIIKSNCIYCDAPPRKRIFTGKEIEYNGIDRVNNSIGYVQGNVVPCCWICNTAKSNMSLDVFKNWILKVYEKFICGGATCLS